MGCGFMETTRAWIAKGAGAPMPAELAEHIESCPDCRGLIAEVSELREVAAAALGTFEPLGETRAAAMRQQLAGAARGRGQRNETMPRSRIAMIAAALVLLGAAAYGVFWPDEPMRAGSWIAEGDAELRRLSNGPDEEVMLRWGAAWFEVEPLGAGQRFVVLAGDGEVEVRGTRFRCEVQQGRLISVDTAEGLVLVRVGGEEVARLAAGERWLRPDAASAFVATETPEAAALATQTAGAASESEQQAALQPTGATQPEAREGNRGAPESVESGVSRREVRSAAARRRRFNVEGSGSGSRSGPGRASSGDSMMAGQEAPPLSFAAAWRLYRGGRYREAAVAFEALSRRALEEPGRRGELLYWAARAEAGRGNLARAARLAERSLEASPAGWWAPEAREMLGAARSE